MPEDPMDLGIKIGDKRGGIHKGDDFCGLYRSNSTLYLVKRDLNNSANDIAEYLSSKLFNKIAPGYGAEVNILHEHHHTYLVSTYFNNYQDLYKCAGFDERPLKQEYAESIFPVTQYITEELLKLDEHEEYVYKDYEKAVVTSLFLGDFSLHSGNLGVVTTDNTKKLVRIDFGAAMRSFSAEINPFQSIGNRMGLEKNYLKRDHPLERIFCRTFCVELCRVAQIDLNETIMKVWKKIKIIYCQNDLERFALQISPEAFLHLDDIDVFLCHRLKQRQAALSQMAWEIELALKVEFECKDELREFLLTCSTRDLAKIKKLMISPHLSTIAPFYLKEFQSALLEKTFYEVEQEKKCIPEKALTFFEENKIIKNENIVNAPPEEEQDPLDPDWFFRYSL